MQLCHTAGSDSHFFRRIGGAKRYARRGLFWWAASAVVHKLRCARAVGEAWAIPDVPACLRGTQVWTTSLAAKTTTTAPCLHIPLRSYGLPVRAMTYKRKSYQYLVDIIALICKSGIRRAAVINLRTTYLVSETWFAVVTVKYPQLCSWCSHNLPPHWGPLSRWQSLLKYCKKTAHSHQQLRGRRPGIRQSIGKCWGMKALLDQYDSWGQKQLYNTRPAIKPGSVAPFVKRVAFHCSLTP